MDVVGRAYLYEDGTLVITSKNKNPIPQKKIYYYYGYFYDFDIPWAGQCRLIKTVQICDTIKVTTMEDWFRECIHLKQFIGLENLDVSDCVNFSKTFYGCESLIDINLSNWKIQQKSICYHTFKYCTSLENVLLPNEVSSIDKYMFGNCKDNLKIHWKDKIFMYSDLLEYEVFI